MWVDEELQYQIQVRVPFFIFFCDGTDLLGGSTWESIKYNRCILVLYEWMRTKQREKRKK